ncbi:MAG: HicB family protein [Sphingomonadales bacterium]|nr:MAG: HicB family protein [Sphingomonadales bacterium]
MNRVYLGVIEAGEGEGYSVFFPDFPGCISAGDDMVDVTSMGMEALQLHIDMMAEDGEAIPEPSTVDLDALRAATPDAQLVQVVAIPVSVPASPATVAVRIDAAIAREIDAIHQNRGRFIADAVRHELARVKATA